ncbi:MAG: universal stress protein [Tepidiformaceae bacterium]
MSDSPTAAHTLHEQFADEAFAPRSVVVPLDGSSDSEAALALGEYFAKAFGVELRIVHAIPNDEADASAAEATFESYVAEVAGGDSAAGIPRSTEVSAGEPSEVILKAASAEDLIVIASHGRGGLRAALFGSVADKVVRGAHGSVVVVPVSNNLVTPPIHTVLIAVDESECAAHAAAVGRSLAARLGATVNLINSYMPTPVASGLETPYVPAQTDEFEREAAKELVSETAEPGEHGHVVLGPTVEAIADVVETLGVGLVVAGASGKGFFSRLLTGSVSESLMHKLDRPLLIVPAPKD